MYLFNILLTKIFNLMKKTELRVKALLFSVVFFFMGMVTINAQYVSPDEAILTLKGEIENLEADIPGASNDQMLEIAFKHKYFRTVMVDISQGAEVGGAISDNAPDSKPTLHSSGMVAFSNDDPNFKQDVSALIEYTQNLLAD
jgi:hypothetical protein